MIKTIHQIWLGSPVPQKFMGHMADWQLRNEGWRYCLWTEPLHNMYNEDLYWDAHLYVKPDAVWQMRADIMRYEILYRHGGFYADTDTVPHRPLGGLFEGLQEWAVAESGEWVSNTYLYTEPDTTLFSQLVERQADNALGKVNAAAGVVSGPQYLTPIWREYAGHVDERTELWHPYTWTDVRKRKDKYVEIPEDAYSTHTWEHSRSRLKQSDKRYRDNAALRERGL